MQGLNEVLFGSTGPRGGKRDGVVQTMAKSTVRTVARELARGILGSLLGSKGAADVAGGLAEPSYLTMRCHTQ